MEGKDLFDRITQKMLDSDPEIAEGPMMHAPGLKYRGKVFAFFHDNEMVFRLGKKADPSQLGIREVKYLSPFKNKPPMKGWLCVSHEESELWEHLAERALTTLKLG